MKSNLHLLITVTILLCFPKASFGQAPDLGRASGFTIFTDAGAITNIGASVVTGDVGNVTGAYDFTGGTINGTHFVTGSAETVAAKTDLDLAYADISARPGTVLGVTIVDATLTPGIYDTGAKSTLDGTLTLDGQGDPNALFIIKIGGAFSTGTGAIVKLINGASMSNVFWQVQGAFKLGDNSKFIGNVLAGGAIELLEGSSLEGRALSTEGAISLHSNNVSNAEPCVPVTIGTQPSDLALCAGTGTPSFTLVAAGSGPYTYQWQYLNAGVWNNVVDGTPTNALYTTATTATLGISGITALGTYSYKSILTNCLGTNTVTSNTVTLTINPNTGTPVFTPGNTTLCQDSPDVTYLATAANSISIVYSVLPASAGIINGSTGVMNWDAAFSGFATIKATANGLCTTTFTDLIVTVNPLPLAAGVITGPESVCQTATGKVYSVALITNATGYIWTLPAGATIVSGANTNSITVDFSATAVNGNITVQGSNGCGVGTVSPPLAILVKITLVALASSNSPVCEGSSINLTAQTQVGGVYIWTGPNGFASNVQNPVIPNATAAQAGVYTLVVVTSCYCCYSAPSTVTVVVNNCNVADLSITMTVDNIHPFMGRTVEFAVTATNQGPDKATGVSVSNLLPDGYTYVSSTTSVSSYDSNTGVWNIGTLNQGESERMTIIATVNSMGNYTNAATVTGIEADGDLTNNVASVTTIPTDFFIPEAFSPNGDGINDLFVIRGIQNYPANKIVIYNRWGNKVYEASPYLNNWDGQATIGLRVNGSDLPTGTYFYLLDLGDGTDMIKGTIYLNQ